MMEDLKTRLASEQGFMILHYRILIIEYGLTLNEAYVYSFIWGFNRTGKDCTLSQPRIAESLGLSLSTVKRTLKSLLNKGFIYVRYGKCEKGLMCTYHI